MITFSWKGRALLRISQSSTSKLYIQTCYSYKVRLVIEPTEVTPQKRYSLSMNHKSSCVLLVLTGCWLLAYLIRGSGRVGWSLHLTGSRVCSVAFLFLRMSCVADTEKEPGFYHKSRIVEPQSYYFVSIRDETSERTTARIVVNFLNVFISPFVLLYLIIIRLVLFSK